MVIVPIREDTLDLIAAMNEGIKPYVDKEIEKIFVYRGHGVTPKIDYYFNINEYLPADEARSANVTFFTRLPNFKRRGA